MTYTLLALASSLLTALVGVYAYKRRAGVDVQKKRDDTRIELDAQAEGLTLKARKEVLDAQAEPVKILKDELLKRETELHNLREQDRAERTQYVETLTAMKTALEKIALDISAHRSEERDRSGAFHGRIDEISKRLLVIETRLGMDG